MRENKRVPQRGFFLVDGCTEVIEVVVLARPGSRRTTSGSELLGELRRRKAVYWVSGCQYWMDSLGVEITSFQWFRARPRANMKDPITTRPTTRPEGVTRSRG